MSAQTAPSAPVTHDGPFDRSAGRSGAGTAVSGPRPTPPKINDRITDDARA